MRKFNSIKKSRKKSKDIDEKIEYLDKECQKTGLNEITMGTSGVYQGSTTNPNEKYEEFTAINFNGYPLAMSGDGKQGHQSTGGASIRASDGAAMAPPHPVTGEIRVASTKAGIDPMFKIAVPGEKPTPQHRMTGDILWFYNASYNGGQGRWQSLEYNSPAVHGNGVYPGNRAGWGYWGSNFIGFPLLRDDEKYSDLFAALNDSDGIQFNPNDIGTPTTTIFFQNDLGDPSHLPINIGEMSPEAFEYFRRRVNGNNNVASGGVNYDLYNYLHKRYGIGAANWYENNPTKPHGSNPNIPTPEAPYVPLASNSNDSRYSDVVSDTDINTGLGAKPGDQLAFGGFGGKPTPPTKKSDFKGIKRNAATTAATMSVNGMGMSPAAFEKKYGISPQDFLNLPENKTSDKKYLEETSKSRHFKRKVKNEDVIHNTKFNVIKKSRKKSKGIDEKIVYLNKECKKNNLQEIMSTSNMYVDGGTVPNQDYINFEGQSQGGYKLGLSAADGNNLGNAIIQNGEAFSPPHPVTGVRRRATHVRDGLGSTTALRPGVTIRRGFSDNAPPYTMGGALWFYDPNYNNGEGQWYNLEWGNFTNTTGWGFWDTIKTGQFAGIYKFETDLSKHPAANIASKIAGINFGNNGNIGTPQTIVLTKTDLGDPNSLPINIDVSPQAYEYLKNRAGQNVASGANYDLYNWILKTYNNMPAAEWYLKTGKTEGNPYLPGGAYVPKADAGETVPDETEIAGLTRYDAEVLIDIIKGKGKSQTRINAINQMKKHRPDILKHLSNLGYV